MVLNHLFASTVPQEYNSCLFCSSIMHEQTSLSLNQLIREGVNTYRLSNKKRAEFELNLCNELKKTGGDPNQLRRVFTQMIDCFVESVDVDSPRVFFETHNIIISERDRDSDGPYKHLTMGDYVSLRVRINASEIALQDGASRFHPNVCDKPQVSFNSFIWSQVSEVIQVHGGTIIWMDYSSSQSATATTSLAIILPALNS